MNLIVVLTVLTVFRLTHLVTDDLFPPVAAVRDAVARRFGAGSAITYLIRCQWCVSVYVGAVVVWIVDAHYGLPAPLMVWAAASAVTGYLSAFEP